METRKAIAEKITNEIVSVNQKMKEVTAKCIQLNDAEKLSSLVIERARLLGKYEGLIEAYDMLIGYHR